MLPVPLCTILSGYSVNRSSAIKDQIRHVPSPSLEEEATPEDRTDADETVIPFPRRVLAPESTLITDEILPPGVLLEFVPADFLGAFINYVDLHAVITERDPEEDERYINVSNRFYTHFHEFGTAVHVIASSRDHWWYFCYDIDASDCAIGRVERDQFSLPQIVQWVYKKRTSDQYPTTEIDVRELKGWRSFQ